MIRRNFLKKKTYTALLTLVTALTLTGCSLSFKAEHQNQVNDIVTKIDVPLTELSNIIDNSDFKNENDLATVTEEITTWASEFAENSEYLSEFQTAKLVRVIDGDTIIVDIEGDEYRVRMIGIDTPESVHPDSSKNTEDGILASEYTKDLLKNVETVYLQKDVSETDKYGRLLRYIWLEIPENDKNINEIASKMINGILLLDHVAEPKRFEPDISHADDFDWIYDNM